MSEYIIPVATKAILSGTLALLAAVLAWQAVRIWINDSLLLAPFAFVEDGKPSAESGEQFARMVRADLVQLARLYNVGDTANPSAVPTSGSGEPAAPMQIPTALDASFFEEVEIKAYGIDLASIFKAARRYMESPSEISGNVTQQGELFSVFAELKSERRGPPQRWSVSYSKTLPDASRGLACRLFRFLAASAGVESKDAALFAAASDEEFCLFNDALIAYDQYRLRRPVISEEDGLALLADAKRPLDNLLNNGAATFPYVHKLAALVSFEQRKYVQAEREIDAYNAWLAKEQRHDPAAEKLLAEARTKKLQTTPAVSRLRPVQPGTSVGVLERENAGMVTLIARDKQGARYLLSATPVLGTEVGAAIVQPATRDGGTDADVVATLADSTPTIAAAKLDPSIASDPSILELGAIKGVNAEPEIGDVVVTFGFDGKRREGRVISTGASLLVETVLVERAIVTSDISSGGEIGGPVLAGDGELVGMIFASGQGTTVIAPVDLALEELELELSR